MFSSRNGDLPKELVREILLRLPVKELLRCKRVCKEWCALIGSRSFIECHYGHESNQDYLLIKHDPMKEIRHQTYKFELYPDDHDHEMQLPSKATNYLSHLLPNDEWYFLLGPANDIFCVVREHNRVALLNTTTRQLKPLPPIFPLPVPEAHDLRYGFVFDPFSFDYKVIAFEKYGEDKFFYVYNLRSDSWRRSEVVDLLDAEVGMANHDVALNKAYHWLLNHDHKSILAFDMRSKNNIRQILVPDFIRDDAESLLVGMTACGTDHSSALSFVYTSSGRFLWRGNMDFW